MNDNLIDKYTDVLNEIKWDTNSFKISSECIDELKSLNVDKNFDSIDCFIKSFKIKYTYLFTNNNDIQAIIKYIKEYTYNNLPKYLYLVTLGLSDYNPDFYLENYIKGIINVCQKKLVSINHENVMDIVDLDLYFNDEYNVSVNLVNDIEFEVIDKWINFEIVLINDNYLKNFDNDYYYNVESGNDIVTYLTKLLKYFNSFLLLKNDNILILKYQLKIFQKIILNLIFKYRQNITVDQKNDSIALLKNIIVIYDYLLTLSKDQVVITINKDFKRLNNDDSTINLLEGELIEYKKLIIRFFNHNVVAQLKTNINKEIAYCIQNYSDDNAWTDFFKKNNSTMDFVGKLLANNNLLTCYYFKIVYINTSLILKKVINNVVLNGKLNQEMIEKLKFHIHSLDYYEDIIEYKKFKDYLILVEIINQNDDIKAGIFNFLNESEIKEVINAYT
ncbi:hypothetical protein ACO0R3_003951 [Hanseniaspora guilliermondii]